MRRIEKTKIFVIILFVIVMSLSACNGKNEENNLKMNIEIIKDEDGASHMKRNGSEQICFQVEEGRKNAIEIIVDKQAGTLNMYIAKDGVKENAIYEGNNVLTSQFVVNVETTGDYIIHVEAHDFVGDYNFELSDVK